MPHLPEDLFVESIRKLVAADIDWVPDADKGSLYLRPFMFASEAFLGVRPAKEYLYCVIASPVGGYFKGGKTVVTLWVSHDQVRAVPGGTGAAKCGGNYAASLQPQSVGIEHGCDQVLFLDAVERRWIEERGGMNIMFVFNDGSIVTPPLNGSILPGVTRDSAAPDRQRGGLYRQGRALQLRAVDGGREVRPPHGMLCLWHSGGDHADRRSPPERGNFIIGNGDGGEVARSLREGAGRHPAWPEAGHAWLDDAAGLTFCPETSLRAKRSNPGQRSFARIASGPSPRAMTAFSIVSNARASASPPIRFGADRDIGVEHHLEGMIGAWIDLQLDRHARRHEARGIIHVFLQEEIERADADIGGRKAREVIRARRRGIRRHVGAARLDAQIGTPAEHIIFRLPDEMADMRIDVRSGLRYGRRAWDR